MLSESLYSHEIYEDLRKRLPDFPVGFRGQPYQYAEKTLSEGFDIARPYYAFDCRLLTWETLQLERDRLLGCFAESMNFGLSDITERPHFTDPDYSADRILSYYQQHPTEYSSILVLQFPGEFGTQFYSPPRSYECPITFQKALIPQACISGVVTLDENDFLQSSKVLKDHSDLDERQKLSLSRKILQARLAKKYIEAIVS